MASGHPGAFFVWRSGLRQLRGSSACRKFAAMQGRRTPGTSGEANMDLKKVKHAIRAEMADLSGSTFNDVSLSGSSFNNVNLSGCDIENVNLSGGAYHCVNLSGCRFDDLNMSGCRWHDVNLSGIRIDKANLAGASIKGARMEGMTIDGILVSDLLEAWHAANPPKTIEAETERSDPV
jgi:uncharacterized protein YjbI with pentapeptide repeats